MIDKKTLTEAVNEAIKDTDLFVVDIRIEPADSIVVELDSPDAMDIDTCSDVTRRLHEILGPELDDYDLEVGSAGVTAPFRVRQQYVKNLGNDVEVLTGDGRKLKGRLAAVDDDTFTIETEVKVKTPGEKRPHVETVSERIAYDNARRVQYAISFK